MVALVVTDAPTGPRTRPGRAPARLVLFAALVVALPGCSGGGTDKGEPPIGNVPQVDDYSQVVLPLDSYGFSTEDERLNGIANELLLRDCVKRFGFDLPDFPDLAGSALPLHSRRYGILNAQVAAAAGYSDPAVIAERERIVKTRAADGAPKLSAQLQALLEGTGESVVNGVSVPAGGCQAEVRSRLEEGAPAVTDMLVFDLQTRSAVQVEQDSRLRAVFAEWSTCMRRAGYSYRTPWDANDDPRWWVDQDSASDLEIATATADVGCREETNLIGLWYAVETAYQTRLVEENSEQLRALEQYIEVYRHNVAEVVAGG